MSANNQIIIYKKHGKFIIEHWDLDCGKYEYDKFPKFDNLEDAIREANKFMNEVEVEYGLNIKV